MRISYDQYFSTQQKVVLRFIDLAHFCDPNSDVDFGRDVFLSIIAELMGDRYDRYDRLINIKYFVKFIESFVSDKNIATFIKLLFIFLKAGDFSSLIIPSEDLSDLNNSNGGVRHVMSYVEMWNSELARFYHEQSKIASR